MTTYIPTSEKIIHQTTADFTKRAMPKPVHIVQYDKGLPILAVKLYSNNSVYEIPTAAIANIRFSKKDGTCIYNPALGTDPSRSIAYFEITAQMTIQSGVFESIIELIVNGKNAGSSCISLQIDRNPVQEGDVESTNEIKSIIKFVEQAETAKAGAVTAQLAAELAASNAAINSVSSNAGAMSNNPAPETAGVRNIRAGTADLTVGVSSLTTGSVYFVYEV